MESENILPLVMDKCRICMEHNGTINIFGRRNLPEDIRLCTSVKIREDDLLPKIICISCRRSIQKAMKLRRTALDTNAKMRFVGGLTKDLEIPNVYRTSRDKKQKRSSRHVEADSQTKDSKRDQIPKLKIVMTNGTGHSAELTHFRCKEEDMSISQGTAHCAADRFICEICSRKCPSRYSLYLHSRWHDDSKKLHCPLCQKSCISKSDLRKHNRTHTGEKPFTCDVCKRSFSQNSTLKAHKLTHSKKKN